MSMQSAIERRYDIDWLRVIAIGLLLIYHVAIPFQSWGIMVGFITTKEPLPSLWLPMTMLNVWRIPLLFFVSGMGVYFAMQKRNWKQLISERFVRIFIPFLAGIFLFGPVHTYLWQKHFNFEESYSPNPGHLWFLGNIFAYVLCFTPLFYFLVNNERARDFVRKLFSGPWGLLLVAAAFAAEALSVDPRPFELYAMTWHGFLLGMIAFVFGFLFVLAGQDFWKGIQRIRWILLAVAITLFVTRFIDQPQFAPSYLIAIESVSWVMSVLAFGSKHLNRPSPLLAYLSNAAYPVYIVHMLVLDAASALLFPLAINGWIMYVLALLFTLAGCFAVYEICRRINWIRPLLGLKIGPCFGAGRSQSPIMTKAPQ